MFWIEKLWFLPDFKWSSKTKNRNLIFWVIPGCKRVKNLSFEFVLRALRYIAFCLDNNYNRGENETKHDKVPLLLRSVSLETSIYTKTKLRVARENASDKVTISVSLIGWERIENSGPITKQRGANRTPAQTSYDSLLDIALITFSNWFVGQEGDLRSTDELKNVTI